MGLFQLLTLTFVIATTTASRTPLCLQPLQHTSDTERTRNCLCPVLGSPTIIDNFNPDNTGVERLVIFFYRVVDTGQIIRFIPKKELQHRIPDFPEEYGTVKDISDHPSIKNMFEDNASKDTRDTLSNDHASHQEMHSNEEPHRVVVDGQPRELNIAPENDRNNIHGNSEFPPWLIPVNNDSGNHVPHIEVQPFPHPSPYENNPSIDGTKEDLTKDDLTKEDLTKEDLTKEDLTRENLTKEDLANEDLMKEENSYKPSGENENPLDFHNPSSHQHPSPNSESPEGNHEERPTSNEKELHENEKDKTSGPFKPNIDDPQNSSENPQNSEDVTPTEKKILVPQKDHHGRIVGWTTKIITIYRESNEHPHHLITDYPYAHNELLKPHVRPLSHNDMNEQNYENIPSFDYWLKEQLNITTINGNKIPTSSDDITALHTEIRNVLLQNGLMVTKHGTLLDGHGQESSLDNLKLRPILIGKSISYNRFLKHIDSAKFKIPSNSPFLEGLLLTMIKPAKILGIVPLAITSLPHKDGPEHEHPAEQKALLKILPISQVVAFRKYSQAKQARYMGSQRSGPKATWVSQRLRPKVALIRQRLGPKVALISRNNQHSTDSQRRQGLSKKAEKESDYWTRWRYLGKPTETGHRTNEEVPDFRIIGGISATVSGTPLLNRGRSGYAPLTHPL